MPVINAIPPRLPQPGHKWRLDEIVITIGGNKHWLWRAVDQDGIVLDVLVHSCVTRSLCCRFDPGAISGHRACQGSVIGTSNTAQRVLIFVC
jgi:DDE domain